MREREAHMMFLLAAQNAIEVLGAEVTAEMFRRLVEYQDVEDD